MQNAALFARVDHRTVIKLGEFFGQLRFLGELGKERKDVLVNRACAEVEIEAFTHRNGITLYTLRAIFAGHGGSEVDFFGLNELLIRSQRIHVFPGNHCWNPPLFLYINQQNNASFKLY